MEVVLILRELWRRRVIVLAIGLLAIVIGSAVAFRLPSFESRKYEVGIATAAIFVDTPNSQVVGVAPKGSETLGVRANLIASLMAEGDVKAAIARRAGLAPDELEGVSEASSGLSSDSAPSPDGAYVLTTRVAGTPGGDRLPIIEIDAQAPDAAGATKLAEAAVTGLRDFLDSKAASEQVEDAERLQVEGLGSPQARTVVRGPGNMIAAIVALFVFGVGCVSLLGVLALVRGWRIASEFEGQGEFGGELYDLEELLNEHSFDDPRAENENGRGSRRHVMAPRADDDAERERG